MKTVLRRAAALFAILAAAALMPEAARAQGAKVRSGTVDGYYYKWIVEGRRFVVCTNVSEDRGRYLCRYLDWAYKSMSQQFDVPRRGEFEKRWEINFFRWGKKTGRRTRNGFEVLRFAVEGQRANGFVHRQTGEHQVMFLPSKRVLRFYDRMLEGRKCIVHYAADKKEEGLIRKAFPQSRTIGVEANGRSFFSPRFGILLVDRSRAFKRPFYVTVDTAVHEACHYMFGFASFTKPVWFNEGYCYYLQVDAERKLTAGAPRYDMLKAIHEARLAKTMVGLDKLIGLTHKEFRREKSAEYLFYCASWSLFAFLNSEASGQRQRFYDFYNAMRGGADPDKAFRKTFKIPELERKWLAWCAFQYKTAAAKHTEEYDRNADGETDHWVVITRGKVEWKRSDKDFDGRVDLWIRLHPNGERALWAADKDGNGKPDLWNLHDEKGRLTCVSSDKNKDGKPDTWALYNDKKVKTELRWDSDFDGKVDQWAYLKKGKVVRRLIDTNRDGKWDKESKS